MVARVMLTVKEGTKRGKSFVLDHPDKYVVGRTDDCALRLHGGLEYQLVSRHHCLLEVEPKQVRVRDLGSLNGTYVNGTLIGRRHKGDGPEDATEMIEAGYPLADGDELGLGPIVLRVQVDGVRDAAETRPAL